MSTDTLAGSAKDSGLGSLTITTSATSHELQSLSLVPPPLTIGGGSSSSGSGSGSGAASPRTSKPRPRANSKGLLGALEPIQERRRGSSTALDSAAAAALALSGVQRVASSDNNYDHCEDSEYEEEDEEELYPKGGAVTVHTNSDDSLLSPSTPQKDRAEEGPEQNTSPLQAISASPVPAAGAEGGVSVPSNLTAGLLSASHASTFTALNTEPLTTALESTHITPIAESAHSGKESKEGGKEGGKVVAGSFKSVSFSATNQTLQSDNTIRNSSTRMEIKPAASASVSAIPGTSASALPNISTNAGDLHQHQRLSSSNNGNGGNNVSGLVGGTEMEVVDQYDAAARSINANTTTGKTLRNALVGGSIFFSILQVLSVVLHKRLYHFHTLIHHFLLTFQQASQQWQAHCLVAPAAPSLHPRLASAPISTWR